jgi:hypothetical protein
MTPYPSPNIRITRSRRIRLLEHAARIHVKKNAYKVLARKTLRRPFGRPKHGWEHAVQMNG